MGAGEFRRDLVQRHRRGVDDAGIRRAVFEQGGRHQRPGIKADRAARDQVAAAHGDEVRRTRSGADEMDGHGATLAIAQVAPSAAMRGTTSTDPGPAPTSAAASATEGTPKTRCAWGEWVRIS